MIEMEQEIYATGKIDWQPWGPKRPVRGVVVSVLDGYLEGKRLSLIAPPSRALHRGQVHEIIVTDEDRVRPGTMVDRVAYVGFFEVMVPGVVVVGDEVRLGEKLLGKVVGFDETHMPNHLNVVVGCARRLSGLDMGVHLEEEVSFDRDGRKAEPKWAMGTMLERPGRR